MSCNSSPLLSESENRQKESPTDPSHDLKHGTSSNKWIEEQSSVTSSVTESSQAGELISGAASGFRFPTLKHYFQKKRKARKRRH
ncbi:hypothetical protein ACLOJK_027799 [Asimina triloba]